MRLFHLQFSASLRVVLLFVMLPLCFAELRAQSDFADSLEVNYPYNPDANENGAIDMVDLLELLSVFASDFEPSTITIDGISLEDYLVILTNQVAALQADLNAGVGGVIWGVAEVVLNEDNTLTFVFSDGTTLETPILVGPAGLPGATGEVGPAGPAGPQGPVGPPGGPLPSGLGPYPGDVAMWDGTQWVVRRIFGCPIPGSCNYIGDLDFSGFEDESICIFPGQFNGGCPFASCDDGNSLTYNDVLNDQGTNCAGTLCLGDCDDLPCDDGDATTYGETWDSSGTVCSGGLPCSGNAVDCAGAGPCSGISAVNFDGKNYALVEIGSQCWFKENLANDSYRNGDPIPGNLSNAHWGTANVGVQSINLNSGWPADISLNLSYYGRLYNYAAVSDSRGLCPTGFHVPSDSEWTVLENHLGGSEVAVHALKSSPIDFPGWDGDNSSGFSALPGGERIGFTGEFWGPGWFGSWWSSTLGEGDPDWYDDDDAVYIWNRYLSGASFVGRQLYDSRFGLSVRCLRN